MMSMSDSSNKRRIMTFLALILFFFFRWEYLQIEIRVATDIALYIVQCALVISVIIFCLFDLPATVPLALSIAGCSGSCVLAFFLLSEQNKAGFLLPLTFFPVFLFFINCSAIQKKDRVVSKLCLILELSCIPLFLALAVYYGFTLKTDHIIYNYGVFCSVIFFMIGMIYLLLSFSTYPRKQKEKPNNASSVKKRAKPNKSNTSRAKHDLQKEEERAARNEAARRLRDMAVNFRVSALSAALTAAPLIIVKDRIYTFILPMLWLAVLILSGRDNCLIGAGIDRLQPLADRFIKEDRHEA